MRVSAFNIPGAAIPNYIPEKRPSRESRVPWWQPRFYQTCEVLLASMGMALRDFVGEAEANIATKVIAAAEDESAKALKGRCRGPQEGLAW